MPKIPLKTSNWPSCNILGFLFPEWDKSWSMIVANRVYLWNFPSHIVVQPAPFWFYFGDTQTWRDLEPTHPQSSSLNSRDFTRTKLSQTLNMSSKLKVSNGDWVCSDKRYLPRKGALWSLFFCIFLFLVLFRCGNVNFARRTSCNRCGKGGCLLCHVLFKRI